ncbi:unnamed protein product [Anisakis simplex]|uniref:MacB_PCD domain-containing protein n=1 Tax=Anisakis simplex TaxID=6269 RepID=A0A0M3K600_ANISI|nr:unnamed protein product [Anisakis simplex]
MQFDALIGYRRRRIRKAFLVLLFVIAFLACWFFLTVLILTAQEKLFDQSGENFVEPTSYTRRGVQVVVGHYNGNLPAEKRANLTEEQLNANNFAPIAGVGDGGRPVNLNDDEDRLADDTFGINQFNLVVSDKIALNRTLQDVRNPHCRKKTYPGFYFDVLK